MVAAGRCIHSWDNEGKPPSHFAAQRHRIIVSTQERFFFEHYGLTHQDLESYLAAALSAGGDYADLYFEYLTSTSLTVDPIPCSRTQRCSAVWSSSLRVGSCGASSGMQTSSQAVPPFRARRKLLPKR